MYSGLLVGTGIAIVALVAIGLIITKLYKRSTKELAFVRTGFGGQKVIMNGGALIMPVFHEVSIVNMRTSKLEVKREKEQALITGDRMRVDVIAEFYVRVKPDSEAIAQAAQTLGNRTTKASELKELIEGKFVDALRSVASEMEMFELHEKRSEFVQKVQNAVASDLAKNGLELESVSLTGLDQTSKQYFNPDNAFDAQGLLELTESIEAKKKARNDIEQDTRVAIEKKNLEATQLSLELKKEEEYATLKQEQEVAIRRAELASNISMEESKKAKNSENAKIVAEREMEEERIKKDKAIKESEIEKQKSIKLAEQDKEIAVFEKSKEESVARAESDTARAEAVVAEESVKTARETAVANREKEIELVEASKEAERDALVITISAEAEKKAATDKAEAITIEAKGKSDAVILIAEANKVKFGVDAEGKTKINEAENKLNDAQIALKAKLALIETLPEIMEQSVKPLEGIDSIKIIEAGGLTGNGGTATSTSGGNAGSGSFADQIMTSALKYKAQAPMVESILADLGLNPSNVTDISKVVQDLGVTTPSLEREVKVEEPTAETATTETETASTVNPVE